MLSLEKIIEQIQNDAPCVYNILNEIYFTQTENNKENPTADRLLEILTEYDGDNWDTHYWSGRYAQMIEHDNQNNTPIRIPLTEEDLHDLLS